MKFPLAGWSLRWRVAGAKVLSFECPFEMSVGKITESAAQFLIVGVCGIWVAGFRVAGLRGVAAGKAVVFQPVSNLLPLFVTLK